MFKNNVQHIIKDKVVQEEPSPYKQETAKAMDLQVLQIFQLGSTGF